MLQTMGTVTKKALAEAREKVLAQYEAEVNAVATLTVIDKQRVRIAAEREEAIERITAKFAEQEQDLDRELAVAIAGVRENLSAKEVAVKLGISATKQKSLLALLEDQEPKVEDSSLQSSSETAWSSDNSEYI